MALRAIWQFTDWVVQAGTVYGPHVLFDILYRIYGLKQLLFN